MSFFQKSPLNINFSNINFHGSVQQIPHISGPKDGFVSNPLYEIFADKTRLEFEAKTNSKIKALMDKYNLPVKVSVEELEKLQNEHLRNTRITAVKIYSNLPPYLRNKVNLKSLQEAAMLHDYGKVLIPKDILNKSTKLSEREKEIMSLHSELGYELLKNKGFDETTLNLVKYHHQTPQKTGYPAVDEYYEHDISAQILNAADKYNALIEERCYKKPLSNAEALDIIKQDVKDGLISPEIYSALKQAA